MDIGQPQATIALRRAPLAEGQQPGEPAIGGPVGGIAEDFRPVLGHQAGADKQPQADLLGRDMGAHHAGQAVAVGDPEGRKAEGGRGGHQLIGMRGGTQKTEVGRGLELGIARAVTLALHGFHTCRAQAKRPCRYQRPSARKTQ